MNKLYCIDASTEYCPCTLAEAGECLLCSQLRGEEFCDCIHYNGTCIYQEFVWNGYKSKQPREYKLCDIIEKSFLRADVLCLKIKLTFSLCRELSTIGAFVFLRRPGDHESLGLPISIMQSDLEDEWVTVGIKKIGVKTKKIFECGDQILVKAPFYNGIQGVMRLRELKNSSCLILGRGCALAPGILAAQKLTERNNQVFALLHEGRGKRSYFSGLFENLGVPVINKNLVNRLELLTEEGTNALNELLNHQSIEHILCAGNDAFIKNSIQVIQKIKPGIHFSSINNAIMCCGEGNCGSCIGIKAGKIRRACKEQFDPVMIVEGGVDAECE